MCNTHTCTHNQRTKVLICLLELKSSLPLEQTVSLSVSSAVAYGLLQHWSVNFSKKGIHFSNIYNKHSKPWVTSKIKCRPSVYEILHSLEKKTVMDAASGLVTGKHIGHFIQQHSFIQFMTMPTFRSGLTIIVFPKNPQNGMRHFWLSKIVMVNYISRCSFELKQIILLIKIQNQQADETRSCFFRGHVVSIPRLQGDKRGTEPEIF